jgi:hypothetical protein
MTKKDEARIRYLLALRQAAGALFEAERLGYEYGEGEVTRSTLVSFQDYLWRTVDRVHKEWQ